MAFVSFCIYKSHKMIAIIFVSNLLIVVIVWMTLYSNAFANGAIISFKPIPNQINIPYSPRYTQLHQQRQDIISTYTNHDYDCDYIHVKGTGKSGTTWLKLVLFKIEDILCSKTNYKSSYHYKNSKYSMCKDWTNGKAERISHSTNYNRHSHQNIKQILLTQEERYNNNNTNFRKFFMGYNMYNLWKDNKFRYCVFLITRDPRNRIISRANTYNKKINNNTMISNQEKNEIFMNRFTDKFINDVNSWWNMYSLLEKENVMDYYLMFYQDIRLYQYQILKDMIWFAGFEQYINNTLLNEIMDFVNIDNRKGHKIVNSGNLCNFHSENSLNHTTKLYANKIMLDKLSNDLIQKFNRTCIITIE